MIERIARNRYKLALGGLLATASLISLILAKIQSVYSGGTDYPFLPFNLFLAWIPLGAAVAASLARHNRVAFYLVMPLSTLVWLAFFPNAPYLLTDFQHLAYGGSGTPLWYDVILLIWFAWTGLFVGMVSLYLMQEIVAERFNALAGWVFAAAVTILSSLGVFLGRFLRWNSWDLLKDPLPIARDVAGIVRHPLANLPTYVFTILFTLLVFFIYITIHLFGSMMREKAEKP